jgi:sugar lactone lactonase YvrE
MASSSTPTIIEGARVEPVWECGHELGEGALWSTAHQAYFHVDIYGPSSKVECAGPAVYLHDPYKGNEHKIFPVPSFCGTVVPRAGGKGAIVALKDGIHALDLTTGALTPIANPDGKAENRWNDGKCSPEGRFWAGTMGVPGKVLPKVGSLYVLNKDLTTRRALGDITISNGLAWSPDGKTMYYIDTPTDAVYAFDYDVETGEMSNQRTAFAIPPGTGHPDGCCIDSEGESRGQRLRWRTGGVEGESVCVCVCVCVSFQPGPSPPPSPPPPRAGNLWVAQWGGWRVVAYRPSDGAVIAEVKVPTAHVSSCTFGGPELSDLYITTAKEHLSEEERKAQPHAGDIFLVRNVGWKGVPAFEFAG